MAAAAYTRLAAMAERLIEKYGRAVTLKFATDAAPPNPAKPWDPAAPSLATQTGVRAVIFPVEQEFVDETTILRTDQQALVAASGLNGTPDPKTVFIDGSAQYRVIRADPINPGELALVYTLFLRR